MPHRPGVGGRGWAGPRASPSRVPAPTRRSGLQLSAASLGKLVSRGPERARMVPCVSVPPPRGPTSRVQPHSSASCSAPAGSVWSWPAGAAAGGRRAAGTGASAFAAHLLPAPLPHPDARGGPSKAPAPRLSPLAMRSPRFLSLGPRLCFHNLLRAGSLAGTSKLDSPPETDPRRSDPRPRPRTAGSAWVSVKQAQTHRGVSGGSASDRCAPSRLE